MNAHGNQILIYEYGFIFLAAYLSQTYKQDDFYYVFMGDTQYWYDCTYDNKNCLAETKCKTTIGTPDQIKACQKKQGEYANRVQQISVYDVDSMLNFITNKPLTGLIINGDLVMFGHQAEIDRLKEQWLNFFNFKIYPGLGNHDYYTNIDKCPDQECLNRILKYFMQEVEDRLKLRMDYKVSLVDEKVIINGSLSYSWDECLDSTCFHFVQLNYYPTYTHLIDSSLVQWQISPSLKWLEMDLVKNENKPVILNFHAMDYSFTKKTETEFINFLNRMIASNVNILAIMFAHYHERFGLKETWCFDSGRVKIPLMYSGSVPANNYILAQFSAESKSIKSMFQIHAVNDTLNLVERVQFLQTCPSSDDYAANGIKPLRKRKTFKGKYFAKV